MRNEQCLCSGGSPATYGRGLKHNLLYVGDCVLGVARHVRAWIETEYRLSTGSYPGVARHVRAWIETTELTNDSGTLNGRPPRAGVD